MNVFHRTHVHLFITLRLQKNLLYLEVNEMERQKKVAY